MTTYDSACIHMERLGNQFGLVVFDECHHLPGEIRRDAARMSAAPMRLGLTATPERSDGRHVDLDRLIGPVALRDAAGRSQGPHAGRLRRGADSRPPLARRSRSATTSYRVTSASYLMQRRKTIRRFGWQDLCEETGKTPEARRRIRRPIMPRSRSRTGRRRSSACWRTSFGCTPGEPCLVFAGSNAMARDVSRRFLIPCLLNHCGKKERLDVLRGLDRRLLSRPWWPTRCWTKGSTCPRSRWR